MGKRKGSFYKEFILISISIIHNDPFTVIDREYSRGMEMNLTLNQHGNYEFNDDLAQWGKEFLNGQNIWCDIAGPKKGFTLDGWKSNEIISFSLS